MAPVAALIMITVAVFFFYLWYPGYERREVFKSEREHMESVARSFRDIQEEVGKMVAGDTVSVEVKMSPVGVPFVFATGKAGSLSVFPSPDNRYGTLEFKAWNRHYPSQTHIFEGGAVVLVQENQVMRLPPRIIRVFRASDNENLDVVIVENILIVPRGIAWENSWISKRGTGKVEITCENSFYSVEPIYGPGENLVPNRENVVIDLEGKVMYRWAWRRYLEEMRDELGPYYPVLDATALRLTIRGRDNDKVVGNDIFYYELVKRIVISIH